MALQVESNNGGGQKQEKKCVTFFPRIIVKTVRSLLDCNDEELSRIWYSGDEYAAIRQDIRLTIARMRDNQSLAVDQCSRGLEYRTPEGSRSRTENKSRGLYAVLDEQDKQWLSLGSLDNPDALRAASISVSRASREAAFDMGLDDERYVVSVVRTRIHREGAQKYGLTSLLREVQQRTRFPNEVSRRQRAENRDPAGASRPGMLYDVKRMRHTTVSNRDNGNRDRSFETTTGESIAFSSAAA